MAPDISGPPQKGTRNVGVRSWVRRFGSRRVAPKSSISSRRSLEVAPVVLVVREENEVAVLNGGETASHDDGDVDKQEDNERKDDNGDDANDAVSDAGIDAGDDSGGDSVDGTGNNSDDDFDFTKGRKESASLPNFWKKAWDSDEVGKQNRAVLQKQLPKPAGSGKRLEKASPRQNSQKTMIESVIKNTRDTAKGYTERWGSDNDSKAALLAAKSILVSAQTAKKVLDSILQFDPTGYGSTAWAVVSFSLTLVQNDQEMMDLTFEACKYLTDLMTRYARIEALYRESKTKRDKPFERALVGVYVAILVYAAEVQQSIAANKYTRFKRSIMSLTGQPLDDLKKEVEDQKSKLEEWQKVADRERANEFEKTLRSIEDDADKLLKKVDEAAKDGAKGFHGIKLEELWKWMLSMEGKSQSNIRKSIANEIAWWKSSEDDRSRSWNSKNKTRAKRRRVRSDASGNGNGDKSSRLDEDVSEDSDDDGEVLDKVPEDKGRDDEFGDWLFRTPAYTDWITYPQSLLWLHGSSNCGKSALCDAIIKNLRETFQENTKTKKVFASWHFRSDVEETKELNIMLVSLLRQLASKCDSFPDQKSYTYFRNCQKYGEVPIDVNDLLLHLQRFISRINKDVILVFDGVDQVPERQGTRDSDRKLLDIIKRLAHKSSESSNLHILVASRYERDIRLYFDNNMREMLVSVDVQQGLGEALDNFVNKKLESMAMLKEDQDLKELIKKRLRPNEKPSNFIWASAVLRQVLQCRDTKEIKQALGQIPDIITARYQTALSKVEDKDRDRMKRILLWIRWKERSLSQTEFAAAVDLSSPAAVTEICSRVLIETVQESIEEGVRLRETFCFTHFSVQEYLDAVFIKDPEAPDNPSKIARFLPTPGEDAHLQITRRCLAILSACASNRKTRTIVTAKTGSDTDWNRDASATSDSDYVNQHTGASDDSDTSGAGTTDSDSEEDRQSNSTGSSMAHGGGPAWPARRYAAKYWFCHYAQVDREKISSESSGQLDHLENEICSQVLGGTDKMHFWLRMHDPDGEKHETVPSPVYYAMKLRLKEIPVRLIHKIAERPDISADQRIALLDQPGAEGTALQLAAHCGDLKVLNELIKHKVNVNSEKGKYGTAVYASAARGDKDAVEKLLEAGANLDGNDHGDLGSPLHVAAFWGHDAIVEILLEEGHLAVDQYASPFGTALQAASAKGHFSTIKLLLDRDADPNCVGGCLGTPIQAASACIERQSDPGDTVVEELRSRGAKFLDGPLFWTAAYERATTQCATMWRYSRIRGQDTLVSKTYKLLLRKASPASKQLLDSELRDRQYLLASVISQWRLPMADELDLLKFAGALVSRVPFQDQFDAIRQAMPKYEVNIQHLRHSDFMHKACFWAGINCILGKLPHLVDACLDGVYNRLDPYKNKRDSDNADASPVLPFRWAFDDYENRLLYHDTYLEGHLRTYPSVALHSRLHRFLWTRDYLDYGDYRDYWDHPDTQSMMSYMDRSDLIAMELKQQRLKAEARQVQGSASRVGVWAMSDLLDLVKGLVECGDRCTRYQDAVKDGFATRYRQDVEDLTFELFSAVIRLAIVLDSGGSKVEFEELAQPIQLLTTVRLERIKELDAICERELVLKHMSTDVGVGTSFSLEAHEDKMAETIAGQVEQVIGDKLATLQSDMIRGIQKIVKEEVARVIGETRKDMEQEVHHEGPRE